jgi:ABC-type Fe3+/spermidine/putrescine transport system ATPase subunit
MLVDETLSVGDAVFKAKGIQKMRELRDSGTTILFVSHSLEQVRDFCTEAILIHDGSLISRGDTSQVIDEYQAMMSNVAARRKNRLDLSSERGKPRDGQAGSGTPDLSKSSVVDQNLGLRHGTGEARIQNVELLDDHGRPVNVVAPESNLTVRAHVQYVQDVDDSVVNIVLRNEAGLDIFSTSTALEKAPIGRRRSGERVAVDFTFPVPLKQGRYSVATAVSPSGGKDLYLDWVGVAAVFKVSHPSDRSAFPGLIHLPTQVRVFEPDRAQEPRSPS